MERDLVAANYQFTTVCQTTQVSPSQSLTGSLTRGGLSFIKPQFEKIFVFVEILDVEEIFHICEKHI